MALLLDKLAAHYHGVNLVLYFGDDRRWSGQLTLKESLDILKNFEPYVNDYKINLFRIVYLMDEDEYAIHDAVK